MTIKNEIKYVRSGIPRGTKVITERGKVDIENLRTTDRVLTEQKLFTHIKDIKEKSSDGYYLISTHGLESIRLTKETEIFVRDVEIKEDNGNIFPLISWPYWTSIQNLNPSRHMMLSPYNPHNLNPYQSIISRDISAASSYTDNEKQVWLQIDRIEFSGEKTDVFHIELESDYAIAVEYLSVK